MRVCQGVYMRPVETRFGLRAPRLGMALAALSALWGETIVPCGGAAANRLGLTKQNPVRAVYLTSGPNRRLHFGSSVVELRHAPRWQLLAPHRKAGDVIRALAWLGPEEVEDRLEAVLPTLRDEDRHELSAARTTMPKWMAQLVSARLAEGDGELNANAAAKVPHAKITGSCCDNGRRRDFQRLRRHAATTLIGIATASLPHT